MKEIDLLIYDLDGTLVNSLRDITNAVNFALSSLKLPLRSEDEVKGFIGDGVRTLVERSLGEERKDFFERTFKMVKRHYSEHLLDHSCVYPGVKEMLEHFKHKKQAVLTNKPEKFSLQILDGLQIRNYFSAVIGGDTVREKKPSPAGIELLLESLRVERARAVLIGDSVIDIQTSKNAKVMSASVSYGFTNPEELKTAGTDFFLNSIEELKEIFS